MATAASHVDCVVVGDYGLGVAIDQVCQVLAAAWGDGHPLIVDTRDPGAWAPLPVGSGHLHR